MESSVAADKLQKGQQTCTCDHPLAMVSIACQTWVTTYDPTMALKEGTIFPELNKPFYCGGDEDVR